MINNDTNKMRICGQEIISLVNDANEIISDIHKTIANVPTYSKEWVGESANAFAKIISRKENQYDKLLECMQKLGKNLINNANAYDNAIKRSLGR